MSSEGLDLFLRFADGCRHYLEDRGKVSESDSREIRECLEGGGKPSVETLRKVYYVAYPGLQKVARRLGKPMFGVDAVREFYAFDHNMMKYRQGNYICLAYPARVREPAQGTGNTVIIELEPVKGTFSLGTHLPLNKGDWVITHRMCIIESIEPAFARKVADYLRKLGLDKETSFPRKAYKYLLGLKNSSNK